MTDWQHRFKPTASARMQILTAAAMWTLVGAGLLTVGIRWSRLANVTEWIVVLAVAATVGLLKGRFVLRKSARRIVSRILARGDGRCLGGFISWRTWLMVGLMMAFGRALRHGLLPHPVVGFIYAAVGAGLLVGAITLWRSVACRFPESDEHPCG